MNPTQLLEAIHAAPFRPFTIRMNSGKSYQVPHPEFAMMAPTKWSLVAVTNSGAYAILPMCSIASLEFLQPANR